MNIETVLITYVQENPSLYDRSHLNYNDESFVEVIWHMFALVAQKNKLDPLDGNSAKRRWETLRSNFIQIHREHENFPCLQSQDAINCFPYYKQMQWLIPFIRKRRNRYRRAAKAPQMADTSPESFTKSPLASVSVTPDISRLAMLSNALDKSLQEVNIKPGTSCNTARSEESIPFISRPDPNDFQVPSRSLTPASIQQFMNQVNQQPPESMEGLNTTNHSLNVASENPHLSIPPGFTPAIAPIRPPCIMAPSISLDHGDISFMNSIIFDMQRMTPKSKLLFKSKVFLMLHEQQT